MRHFRRIFRAGSVSSRAVLLLVLLSAAVAAAQDEQPGEDEYALIKPLAPKSLLLDGAVADGLMVAVGERGHILISRDQGKSWDQARVPTRRALTGVFMHDEELGWAVGHDAVILRTRDGGANWERLNHAPEEERPFLDIWFSDESNGFAVGAYGFFYRTDDGGDSWTDTGLELAEVEEEDAEPDDYYAYDYGADLHLNHVALAPSGRMYIAAEAGSVYRSDDGGATWVTLPSPYEGSFFGTLPLEDDVVLLFGLRGHLFRSEDAGESWTELVTGTQALLTDALVLDNGTIVVVGLAGAVLVSSDGGRSFGLRQQADRQGLTGVLADGEGGLMLLGEFGATPVSASEIDGGREQ